MIKKNSRSACAPKYKVSIEILDDLRKGIFVEDDKELKCYTMCIAQMAGTVSYSNKFFFVLKHKRVRFFFNKSITRLVDEKR